MSGVYEIPEMAGLLAEFRRRGDTPRSKAGPGDSQYHDRNTLKHTGGVPLLYVLAPDMDNARLRL